MTSMRVLTSAEGFIRAPVVVPRLRRRLTRQGRRHRAAGRGVPRRMPVSDHHGCSDHPVLAAPPPTGPLGSGCHEGLGPPLGVVVPRRAGGPALPRPAVITGETGAVRPTGPQQCDRRPYLTEREHIPWWYGTRRRRSG